MLPFLSIIFSFDLYASVFDAVDQQLAIWKKKQPSFDTKNPGNLGCLKNNTDFRDDQNILKKNVMIFVSFSLPDKVLKNLFEEAQKCDGILVMQGLHKNSFKKTSDKLQSLEISISIDPKLFKDYGIHKVPTFLKNTAEKTLKISGNIPLSHALKRFQEA